MVVREKKLKFQRTDLLSLAEKRLAQVTQAHELAVKHWVATVHEDVAALASAVTKAKKDPKKLGEAIREFDDRKYARRSKPSEGDICQWQHKVNWLKKATDEIIPLTNHEFAMFDTDRCEV